MLDLQEGENSLMITWSRFATYQRVTDRQTDGQILHTPIRRLNARKMVISSGYNYDSTSLRRPIDARSSAYQRSLSAQ